MKRLLSKNRYFLPLVVVLVVAAFLRFWQLGKIPVSMADDEVRLVYSAISIWKTQRDTAGRFLPLVFAMGGYTFNPVPIYLTSPFVGLFGLTMVVSRLPFALAGILTVFLVYRIAYQFCANRTIGTLAAAAMAFSAWHLQLSRMAYEGGMALFFYTLGTYLFLRTKKDTPRLLVASLVTFFLGFYSYSGFKLTLVPIVAILVWYKWRQLSLKQMVGVGCFLLVTYGSLFYLGKTQGALTYGGRLFFFENMQSVALDVELERRASGAPELLRKLYHNKLTVLWKGFLANYEYAFSPQYLFSSQEGSGIFSVWSRGQLYYHEAILILLGILYLSVKRRRELVLALLMLAAGAIPAGAGPPPTTYTIRASFMLPWLMFLVGSGIASIGYFVVKPKWGTIVAAGACAIVYIYFIGGYLTQYYFEWMRYGAKYYAVAEKDLADFLLTKKEANENIVVDGASSMTFLQYAFYAKLDPHLVQSNYGATVVDLGAITLRQGCDGVAKQYGGGAMPQGSWYIISPDCSKELAKVAGTQKLEPSTVIRSPDNLDQWYVYKQ